jgi:hypothetical protein
MADNDDNKPTIERGSYGDRGVLENGRPDGLGSPSKDQTSTSDQLIKVPTSFTRKKK